MKRFRLIGVALLAVFAMSVVASATASAVEFLPTKGVKILGKATSKAILETLGGTKVECSGGSSEGEISGPVTVSKVKITFTGCKSSFFACESAKAGKETIVTHEITGTLGIINEKPLEAGILFATTKAGDFFTEFDCAGGIVKNKVLGRVICAIAEINKSLEKFTLTCKQKGGDQTIKRFVGGAEDEVLLTSINGGTEESSGEEATAEITTTPKGTKAEIMA
jgi:hypothetical protein